MEELTVGGIISNGISRGLKNLVAVVVNAVLWALTVWIPYLNVGTTIGLMVGLVIKMKNGEDISMTEIFNPIYRKRMGEFFLASAFVGLGVSAGMVFFIIPGMVIAIAWSLAVLLVMDKEMNPIEAISKSNEATYGKKWTIFLGLFVIQIIIGAAAGILGLIPKIGTLFALIVMILSAPIMLGANSYIYGTLVKD